LNGSGDGLQWPIERNAVDRLTSHADEKATKMKLEPATEQGSDALMKQLLAADRAGKTMRELMAATGMPRAEINRFLYTWKNEGVTQRTATNPPRWTLVPVSANNNNSRHTGASLSDGKFQPAMDDPRVLVLVDLGTVHPDTLKALAAYATDDNRDRLFVRAYAPNGYNNIGVHPDMRLPSRAIELHHCKETASGALKIHMVLDTGGLLERYPGPWRVVMFSKGNDLKTFATVLESRFRHLQVMVLDQWNNDVAEWLE
jgi:hypothetical protein